MIHPSYLELMEKINENVDIGDEPVVNSRYSIVCATAKRARQLIDGDEPLIDYQDDVKRKPLSIAVDEMDKGLLKIQTPEEKAETDEKIAELNKKPEKKAEEDSADQADDALEADNAADEAETDTASEETAPAGDDAE